METTYETSLLATFPSLPVSLVDKEEKLSLQTQIDFSSALLSSSNKLQGDFVFTSTTYTQGDKENSHFNFDIHLQDSASAVPILASGSLDTLYTDQVFYFNIQDFLLSMGEGNAEVSFINLLAQQLAHKWVSLDKSEHF
jgi:hypothetical protein